MERSQCNTMVLLWSSSKTPSERSQCHQHGIAVILLKDIFKRDPYYITMVLLWSSSRISLSRSRIGNKPILLLDLEIIEEHHRNTMMMALRYLQRCVWGGSQQYHDDGIGISQKMSLRRITSIPLWWYWDLSEDISEEDHSNTILMALRSFQRRFWEGSQQYHDVVLGSLQQMNFLCA